jgi:hypothetical protein
VAAGKRQYSKTDQGSARSPARRVGAVSLWWPWSPGRVR